MLIPQRIATSLTTIPSLNGWLRVGGVTSITTITAGICAACTGFINPIEDYDPPKGILKPLSAFIFPSLFEEIIWRSALLPSPAATTTTTIGLYQTASIVLCIHVLSHPIAAMTIWPRGRKIFNDKRFLLLATIVLGGTTLSYIVSGGSIWAAAFTHGIPVILWRDFFSGEKKMIEAMASESRDEIIAAIRNHHSKNNNKEGDDSEQRRFM